jgi:transcriptional regulator with XRE-family HTH domain
VNVVDARGYDSAVATHVPANPVAETAEQRIGPALKRLREKTGHSLRSLAGQMGFSASFVSQVENGLVSPSIGSLEKMASALGVTLADLFAMPDATDVAIVRANARPSFRSSWSKARVDALSPLGGDRTLDALLVTLEAGGSSGKRPSVRGVDHFAMVVEGHLRLTHSGEDIALSEGDTAWIRGTTPHRWHNPGRQPGRVLIVSSRRG